MLFFNRKGTTELTLEKIIAIVLLLAFLSIATLILITVFSGPSVTRTSGSISCYISNGLKSSIPGKLTPSLCFMSTEDEPVTMGGLSDLMVSTWFMYGKGRWNLKLVEGKSHASSKFQVTEEFSLKDLHKYLTTHSGDVETTLEKSDYDYLQGESEIAKGQTICVDSAIKEEDYTFTPEQNYYVLFYDDVLIDRAFRGECGDKVVLSIYPNYDQGEPYYCIDYFKQTTTRISDGDCEEFGW